MEGDIRREIISRINARMNDRKAIIITGPRQSGKITLVTQLAGKREHLWLNADDSDVRSSLAKPSSRSLKRLIGKNKVIIIDEAQRILNIGLCIKLIVDNVPGVKVIATGSSCLTWPTKSANHLPTGNGSSFCCLFLLQRWQPTMVC